MNIGGFEDFKHVFVPNGLVMLIYIYSNQKKACRTRIKKLTTKTISLSLENPTELDQIPNDQILSAVYMAPQGLYGFHSKIQKQLCKKGEVILDIIKPRKGWKIQRRQFIRLDLFDMGTIQKTRKVKAKDVACDKEITARFYNISQGGLGIETNLKLSMGTHILVNLKTQLCSFKKEPCVIVWESETPLDKRGTQMKYMYGAKFLKLSPVLKKKLETI